MAKHTAEKVADVLVEGCSNLGWNVQLFVGHLLEQPPRVQKAIINCMLEYIRQYKYNAEHPSLSWRTDPEAAELIQPVDLEPYDIPMQPRSLLDKD